MVQRTRGLRAHVHPRSPVQVSAVCVPPWTILDTGELQLKLQLDSARKLLEHAEVRRPRRVESLSGGAAMPLRPWDADPSARCARHAWHNAWHAWHGA